MPRAGDRQELREPLHYTQEYRFYKLQHARRPSSLLRIHPYTMTKSARLVSISAAQSFPTLFAYLLPATIFGYARQKAYGALQKAANTPFVADSLNRF